MIDSDGDYPGTGSDGETGWGDGIYSGDSRSGGSGGGLSTVETEPAWQVGVVPSTIDSGDARAVPDVAMDSGVAEDTTSSRARCSDSSGHELGGRRLARRRGHECRLADLGWPDRHRRPGPRARRRHAATGYTQTLPALYSLPSADFHDIIYGNNGYSAGPGSTWSLGRNPRRQPARARARELPTCQHDQGQHTAPDERVAGQPFGFSVQVDDSDGNPVNSGTVTVSLTVDPTSATLIGTVTEPITDGTATFSGLSIEQVANGYTLTATVTGSSVSTTAGTINVTIPTSPYVTEVAVSSSPASPIFGEPVTLTATVSSIGGGTPTGTVSLKMARSISGKPA